jgi:hypothetical protein
MWKSVKNHKEIKQAREFYFVWGQDRTWEGLRYGDWKIVRRKKGEGYSDWELYNLGNDPYESQNHALTQPEISTDLVSRFNQQKLKDKLK